MKVLYECVVFFSNPPQVAADTAVATAAASFATFSDSLSHLLCNTRTIERNRKDTCKN